MNFLIAIVLAWLIVGRLKSVGVAKFFEDMKKAGEFRNYMTWAYDELESTGRKLNFSRSQLGDLMPPVCRGLATVCGPFAAFHLNWLKSTKAEWDQYRKEQLEKLEPLS